MRRFSNPVLAAIVLFLACTIACAAPQSSASQIDRDLTEVTVLQLQTMYASGKYTVTQATRWYLNRIAHYDGVYHAVIHVDSTGALATAAAEDAAKKRAGKAFKPTALWGIPIVVKANTSVKGLVTSNGWTGYTMPGHELVAPTDATIVAKLKNGGAVILGQSNMPDFANSDTTISSAGGRTGNAYNWRFSPGGSSGGTVTSVSANFAIVGTGTDTSNSIRMPSGASGVVGVLPTRGLVSIAGIHPLDWLLDNTGPIARNVTDAAIALGVMAGEDPKDTRTQGAASKAQPGPYTGYLRKDALKGKRFGVPAFIIRATGNPFVLTPESRLAFMKAIEGVRAAGAEVILNDAILPPSFERLTDDINTQPYVREGVEQFLRDFGPQEYHSTAEFTRATGLRLPSFLMGPMLRSLETDIAAESNFFAPQRMALAIYEETLTKLHLDGFLYPALQIPSTDETARRTTSFNDGPHSLTAWVNKIGVPAVVVPAGYYANGLPFGLEFSARPWKDGDLLGWAFAYEQATLYRKAPVLTER